MLESNLAEHGCASITRNKYHHHQQHDSTTINSLHIHLTNSRPSAQQHIIDINICSHTLRILFKIAAAAPKVFAPFFPYFQASGKNLNFSRRLHKRSRNSPI